MLHVAICDDEENEIEYLKYAVEDWAKKEDIITNIETYASAESFLFQYEECKNYQILLLDVEMSGMSGICIFRKNCASVPEERSAIPLQTEQSSAG